jgi:polyhydroxybutyrate depolymerase
MNRKEITAEVLKKMTLGTMLLASMIWLSCSNSDDNNNQRAQTIDATFDHGGLTRNYQLYKPANLPVNAPLLFVLHSYSGSASLIRNYSAMNAVADENGFAVCYPQGIFDGGGNPFWNVGYDFHQDQTVDDSDFLKSLAVFLQEEHQLNPEFTFATGMSNGGDMCYLLACEQSDTFKAVAPVAGTMMKAIFDACPQNTVPILGINGDNDGITLWEGDLANNDGYGAYMPVLDSFEFWGNQNNCGESISEELPDLNTSDGSTVTAIKYTSCFNNNQVWLYRINNGGHDWPKSSGNQDISASREIWSFFSIYINNN